MYVCTYTFMQVSMDGKMDGWMDEILPSRRLHKHIISKLTLHKYFPEIENLMSPIYSCICICTYIFIYIERGEEKKRKEKKRKVKT